MPLKITQVDSFTDKPFGGNPAAVCLLPRPADASWMQRVAREMNLSETAFLVRRDDGAFDLRWFTPAVEVDLCGHATLASAHVLWEDNHLSPNAPAVFHTLSGQLSAVLRDGWIEMDFPAEPDEATPAPDGLAAALGTEPAYVGRNRFDYLVEVDTEATVRRLAPNFRGLRAIEARGIMVTARAQTDGFDFVFASSLRTPVSTRIRSPGPRTAASDPTGSAVSAGTRSRHGRRPNAAGSSRSPSAASASRCRVRRSRSCAASC